MNPIIDRIASKIKEEIKSLDFVEGIVFFGSHGRKNKNLYSNLDLFIYYEESCESNTKLRVKEKILEILNSDSEGVSNNFKIDDKWLVYTKHSFIKLEIGIKSISEAIKDTIYIVESRISNPEHAIAYDKNGRVKKIYSENWVKLDDFEILKKRFISESYKFIYYYEKSLASLGVSDSYRTYLNYNTAFYTLVRLQSMVDGNYFNLDQPREFLMNVFYNHNYELVLKYVQASTGMRTIDIVNRKDKFKRLFLEVIEQGIKLFKIEKGSVVIFQQFFDKCDSKYSQFSNLRDISLIPNTFSDTIKIKKGLIFRTASLSEVSKELLWKFLDEKNVKIIIDLRGKNELQRCLQNNRYYDDVIKKKYLINIPIEPSNLLYSRFFADYQREIKIIFEEYFSKAAIDRVIIHCEGGKDRTGIVIAVLLDLLGVSRKLIIEDYLLSFKDTKSNYIESTLTILDDEYGGVKNYLIDHCGVSNKAVDNIKDAFLD